MWDSSTGECLQTFADYFNQSDVNTCSDDGVYCLHAEPQSKPSLWNVVKKECVQQFDNDDLLFSLALSNEGKQCAMGGMQEIIKLFDVASGKHIMELKDNLTIINALAYMPGDKLLVSGPEEDDEIKVWDLGSGKVIQKFKHNGATIALACSPDGKRIAYSDRSDSVVRYFDLVAAKEVPSEGSYCLLW